MITFLFWNLKRKNLQDRIINIAQNYEVDIFMFAEFEMSAFDLLNGLNEGNEIPYYYSPQLGCKKIEIFTRFDTDFIKPITETGRLTVRKLNLPGLLEIQLAITHLISKNYSKEKDQLTDSYELNSEIRKVEKQQKNYKTILVGDLNMNPFESGVINAGAFNAVMCRKIAERKTRTIQGKKHPFFYNPMWNLLGDNNSNTPGTIYYNTSMYENYFWNIFDQVLIRPELIDRFDLNELKILNHDGINSLLSQKGLPDKKNSSDHLPIIFKLNI